MGEKLWNSEKISEKSWEDFKKILYSIWGKSVCKKSAKFQN